MVDLRGQGLLNPGTIHANLSSAVLVEMALRRDEGVLAESGALVVSTGQHTGRAPKDRFIVAEPSVMDQVHWGPINQQLDPAVFAHLADKVRDLSPEPRAFRLRRLGLRRSQLSHGGPRHHRKSVACAVRPLPSHPPDCRTQCRLFSRAHDPSRRRFASDTRRGRHP